MSRITILLADDHAIVREGFHALLKLQPDMDVVGEAENGRQALKLALKLHPSIVVMDIAMPMLNGLEATKQILKKAPETKILILSAHGDDAYVAEAMAVGASGFFTKQTAAHVLPEAIRTVHHGETFFSPAIASRLRKQERESFESGRPKTAFTLFKLTSRETEVLQLVAEGRANKETAAELHISIKTVEKHRQSLMEKLDIHDTAGLTRYAISAGVIENSSHKTTDC